MSQDTYELSEPQDANDGPDGTTRDPRDDRPAAPQKRWAKPKATHEPPDPFPHSDTAVSQADGAA